MIKCCFRVCHHGLLRCHEKSFESSILESVCVRLKTNVSLYWENVQMVVPLSCFDGIAFRQHKTIKSLRFNYHDNWLNLTQSSFSLDNQFITINIIVISIA
jgi:hypothetical protein